MRALLFLLRLFSYAFHLSLSAFLLAASLIAQSRHQFPSLGILPLAGDQTLSQVAALGIIGLLCCVLPLVRVLGFLFPLWALFGAYLITKGYFQDAYSYDFPNAGKQALWIVFAALVASAGALATLQSRRGRLYF